MQCYLLCVTHYTHALSCVVLVVFGVISSLRLHTTATPGAATALLELSATDFSTTSTTNHNVRTMSVRQVVVCAVLLALGCIASVNAACHDPVSIVSAFIHHSNAFVPRVDQPCQHSVFVLAHFPASPFTHFVLVSHILPMLFNLFTRSRRAHAIIIPACALTCPCFSVRSSPFTPLPLCSQATALLICSRSWKVALQ